MSEHQQDNAYQVEYVPEGEEFFNPDERQAEFEDPYIRHEVQQAVRGELNTLQQQYAEQQEERADEEKDQMLGQLEADYPFAATERGADLVFQKARECAVEDGADPQWAESSDFVQEVNPEYIVEVTQRYFHPDGSPRNPADESMFGELWDQARARRLEWD
jgi:hypothetical protein